MFGPEWIRINELMNELIKTARSAVLFFAAPATKFWKHDSSSASERVFPDFSADIFGCSTLSKKRFFSTQEFARFLSTVCCCCVCCFAGVVRSNRRGGLCAPWMWMMCVSMFPSVRLAAYVSPGRLCVRLRVGILRFARPCARGVICDASGAEAGFSPGRCCAALLCSILCWY